jgi:hypothetical protein
LTIDGDIGACTDPDGFAWEAAHVGEEAPPLAVATHGS